MKKRFISFLSGMVVGAVMFGGSVAYASGILADLSNNQIFVDGTLTPMEAYVINGHNYVKLRDIGQAVGFNVFWDDTAKCVHIVSQYDVQSGRIGQALYWDCAYKARGREDKWPTPPD